MKSSLVRYICLLFLLLGPVIGQENEAYTRVLDKLTSVEHFSDRPVLFIVGFDTSKSMSVQFDRAKQITQTVLSRYSAPGDSIYIFGFAEKASVLPATQSPKAITSDNPDKQIAAINESLLGLPFSDAQGTLFGRAKLFALERAKEFGSQDNTVVLLFSDNYSEISMGTNERTRLQELEKSVAKTAETIPLYSSGVSPLWLTVYTNAFPKSQILVGPGGETDLDNPRLAWAARRVGSQTLEFIAPASSKVETGAFEVVVQFLGSSEPKSASITVDGKDQKSTTFEDGRAQWQLENIKPGSHLLFVQAVLADGKVRSAEMQITVTAPSSDAPTPPATPGQEIPLSPSPTATPSEEGESSSFPIILLIVLALIATALYFFSSKPIKIRVIGPDSEESFMVAKGKTLRLGGSPRVESDLVFAAGLSQTIASVRCLAFGKAKVFANEEAREGTVEVETDEGYSVGASGEPLLTSATVTYSDERGRKQVFTLVKEDASGNPTKDAEHFGGSGEESSDDGSDWRA